MKKYLILMLCIFLTFCVSLCACDGTDTLQNSDVTTATPTDTAATTEALATTATPVVTTAATTAAATSGEMGENAYPAIPYVSSSDEIKKGTPVLDGELDALYLESFCYPEYPGENVNYHPLGITSTKGYMANTHGAAYFLHDDEYLYVCISVYDETLCSRGEGWRNSTEWPWSDDGAEIYLYFSHEINFAIHSDAHNIRSVRDVHIEPERKSSLLYTDTPREDWCARINEDGKSYVIELRVPLPDGVGSGSEIGTLLEINDRFDTTEENMIGALFVLPRYAGASNFLVVLE